MIAALRGKVLFKSVNRIIVDVQGVGYDVAVPLTTMDSLTENGEVQLHIHTALRENALELYGFATSDEKTLFEMLIGVSGIGPRTALTILSGISPQGFLDAVMHGDLRRLTAIPGIGKKSGERILVELKDKIRKIGLTAPSPSAVQAPASLKVDLISSLVNLGYRERDARTAADKIMKSQHSDISLTDAVKLALKELMK